MSAFPELIIYSIHSNHSNHSNHSSTSMRSTSTRTYKKEIELVDLKSPDLKLPINHTNHKK